MNSEASSLDPIIALENRFGPFPPYEITSKRKYSEDDESVTRWRTKTRVNYVTDLGREVKFNGLDYKQAIIFLRHVLTRAGVNDYAADDIETFLLWVIEYASPGNAVRQFAKAVKWYKENIGNPNPPFWCTKAKSDLWLAAIISGICGRQFQFGCDIYPREFNLPHKMFVSRFTNDAMQNNFLERTQEGRKGGQGHKYRLKEDYWETWRNLEPVPGTQIGEPYLFENYIKENLSWLFNDKDVQEHLEIMHWAGLRY